MDGPPPRPPDSESVPSSPSSDDASSSESDSWIILEHDSSESRPASVTSDVAPVEAAPNESEDEDEGVATLTLPSATEDADGGLSTSAETIVAPIDSSHATMESSETTDEPSQYERTGLDCADADEPAESSVHDANIGADADADEPDSPPTSPTEETLKADADTADAGGEDQSSMASAFLNRLLLNTISASGNPLPAAGGDADPGLANGPGTTGTTGPPSLHSDGFSISDELMLSSEQPGYLWHADIDEAEAEAAVSRVVSQMMMEQHVHEHDGDGDGGSRVEPVLESEGSAGDDDDGDNDDDDEMQAAQRPPKSPRPNDLTTVYPSEELLEYFSEIKKGRLYNHIRNQKVNVALTGFVVLVLAMVLGLGIGHFLGWSERLELHEAFDEVREEKMDELTDSLVQCMNGPNGEEEDQDLDNRVIKQLYEENRALKEKAHSSDSKICEESNVVLQERVDVLSKINQGLESELSRLRNSFFGGKQQQQQQQQQQQRKEEWEMSLLEERLQDAKQALNELAVENDQLKLAVAKARYGHIPEADQTEAEREDKMKSQALNSEDEPNESSGIVSKQAKAAVESVAAAAAAEKVIVAVEEKAKAVEKVAAAAEAKAAATEKVAAATEKVAAATENVTAATENVTAATEAETDASAESNDTEAVTLVKEGVTEASAEAEKHGHGHDRWQFDRADNRQAVRQEARKSEWFFDRANDRKHSRRQFQPEDRSHRIRFNGHAGWDEDDDDDDDDDDFEEPIKTSTHQTTKRKKGEDEEHGRHYKGSYKGNTRRFNSRKEDKENERNKRKKFHTDKRSSSDSFKENNHRSKSKESHDERRRKCEKIRDTIAAFFDFDDFGDNFLSRFGKLFRKHERGYVTMGLKFPKPFISVTEDQDDFFKEMRKFYHSHSQDFKHTFETPPALPDSDDDVANFVGMFHRFYEDHRRVHERIGAKLRDYLLGKNDFDDFEEAFQHKLYPKHQKLHRKIANIKQDFIFGDYGGDCVEKVHKLFDDWKYRDVRRSR